MNSKKIKSVLVIGCGNMPQSLLKRHDDFHFLTYTPSQTKAIDLARKLQGEHVKDLNQIEWSQIDIILLGCKPQQLEIVAHNIKDKLATNSLVITMLAGINFKTQKRVLAHENLIRIMPNITSQVGKGSILVYPQPTSQNIEDFSFLELQAKIYPAQTEEVFDQLMLVTGSGPAYIFYLIRSFERHLFKLGLDPDQYRNAIKDTFSGALEIMQQQDDLSTSELISKVASKGGVTQEAIAFFDKSSFDEIIHQAMESGVERSKEIQEGLNSKLVTKTGS